MKSLSDRIDWYCKKEDRRWKRVCQGLEIGIISLSAWAILIAVLHHGNGEGLQPVVLLFYAGIALGSGALIPVIYQASVLNRWQTLAATLSLGCAVGMSALCALFLLGLQLISF